LLVYNFLINKETKISVKSAGKISFLFKKTIKSMRKRSLMIVGVIIAFVGSEFSFKIEKLSLIDESQLKVKASFTRTHPFSVWLY